MKIQHQKLDNIATKGSNIETIHSISPVQWILIDTLMALKRSNHSEELTRNLRIYQLGLRFFALKEGNYEKIMFIKLYN